MVVCVKRLLFPCVHVRLGRAGAATYSSIRRLPGTRWVPGTGWISARQSGTRLSARPVDTAASRALCDRGSIIEKAQTLAAEGKSSFAFGPCNPLVLRPWARRLNSLCRVSGFPLPLRSHRGARRWYWCVASGAKRMLESASHAGVLGDPAAADFHDDGPDTPRVSVARGPAQPSARWSV